ncbi:hypothetical protein [Cellulomonas triticagri]|uniref:Uncharacterized protein n=1 Tax=Cellulomonas triticagri TaxID=2483352 RepID=A0A3M2JKR3_9CELL|nr:hypothetical protein [Cellulomonas triticagri]RMI14432.1 hypothetical protein EBM89_00195 [Cellulomonas triticagri]
MSSASRPLVDAHLLEALPLPVEGVEIQSPILTLFGREWNLTVACPWRGRIGSRDLDWEDDDMESVARDLIDSDLVAVRQVGASVEFAFSRGTLTATPDSNLDPWVMALPGGLMVGRVVDG